MPTTQYHHIWLSLLETRVDDSGEALALPFLIHEITTSDDAVDTHVLHFALLIQHQDVDSQDANLLLRGILPRLNFEGGGSPQAWEPDPAAVQPFINNLRPAGETWRLYRSHPTDGMMRPFNSLAELAEFAVLSPLSNSGDILSLDSAMLPAEPRDLNEKLNLESQQLASWLTIFDEDPCEQSDTPAAFSFFDGEDFRVAFSVPLTATTQIFDQTVCLPNVGLNLAHQGPMGAITLNNQPLILGEHDLSGGTRINFVTPDNWEFSHRFPAVTSFDFPWRGTNSARVTLSNHGTAELILSLGGVGTPTVKIEIEDTARSFDFGLSLQLRLLAQMPGFKGTPAGGAPDPDDYLLEYPTVKSGEAEPPYPVEVSVRAQLGGSAGRDRFDLVQLPWAGAPSWAAAIQTHEFLSSGPFAFSDTDEINQRLTTFDSPLEDMVGIQSLADPDVDELTNKGELLLRKVRDDTGWISPANQIVIPLETSFQRPGSEGGDIRVVVAVVFDLTTMALQDRDGKLPFAFVDEGVGDTQTWDLDFFSLQTPRLDLPSAYPTNNNQDGTINLRTGSFELTFLRSDNPNARDNVFVYIPGGDPNGDPERRRFQFKLTQITDSGDPFFLRLDRSGLTFDTELVEDRRVDVTPEHESSVKPIRDGFYVEPFSDKARDKITRFEIERSVINVGEVYARMPVPGVDTLKSEIGLRVARDGHGGPPKVTAEVSIDSTNEKPVGSLSVGYFDLYFSNPRLGLRWDDNAEDKKWDVSAMTDGELRVRADVPLESGLTELRGAGAFVVKNIDLVGMSFDQPQGGLTVGINARNVQCSVFDGLIGLRLNGLAIGWNTSNGEIDLFARKAEVDFGRLGGLRGGVSVGNLSMQCSRSRGLRIKAVNAVGFHLDVPPSFSFAGTVAWNDDDPTDSFFAIAGELDLTGMMRVEGLLKYGRGLKENGESVPAIAVYASGDTDIQLGSGLVLKRAGLGAGYNRQLGTLPRDPTVEQILDRIDTLEPAQIENWVFVPEAGVYLSIVGKLVFGSNLGSAETPNGYILSLILSIDTNARAIAAGKMWLFSSLSFTDQHVDRPSLIGALKIDSREPSVRALVRTRKFGAIQEFPQLQQILDQGFAELAFVLSPSLLDINLRKLTYQQNWLGVDFRFEGSWRLSVWRETVLQYVKARATGVFHRGLNEGLGGFDFRAELDARLAYGGIFGRLGVETFGEVSLDFNASASAYIKVEFKTKTIKCNWRKCWTDWIGFSERFDLPRQTISLHLSGGFAFRANLNSPSATAGIRGRVGIDVNIVGHRLRISPSFDLNGDLVDDVRRQVSYYEAQIDRAARLPAARAAAQLQRVRDTPTRLTWPTTDDVPERWILFTHREAGGRLNWVLIPTSETPWLTPIADTQFSTGANSLNEEAGFKFDGTTEQPAFVSAVVSEGVTEKARLIPAWDHRNWVDDADAADSADGVTPIGDVPGLPNAERIKYEKLYGQSLLLLESAELDDTVSRRPVADPIDLRRSLQGYRVVTDPRPRLRSPDFLQDEDRLNLPPDVYPFTYRRRTAPEYEDLQAMVADAQRATLAASEEDRLQNRASIVREMIGDLRNEFGRFRIDSGDFNTSLPDATFTPYVQRVDISDPDNLSVEITRFDGSAAVTRLIRPIPLDSTDLSGLIIADNLHGELRNAVVALEPCQEYRPPATDDGSSGGHIAVQIPIDLRGLFQFDVNNRIQSATLFEILSHFRVLRKRVGIDNDFKVLDPIQVDPPIRIYHELRKDFGDLDDQFRGTVSLEPFMLSDTIEVSAAERKSGGRLGTVLYKILVVPIGRESQSDVQLIDQTVPVPPLRPYVPPPETFPTDISLGFFAPIAGDNLEIFLFRASSDDSQSDGERAEERLVPVDSDLEFELYYDDEPIPASGFYGEAVNERSEADDEERRARDPSSDQGRAERLEREADRTRYRSIIGPTEVAYEPVLRYDPVAGRDVPIPGRYTIALDRLKGNRLGYQFYIRAAGSGSDLLIELPQFVFAREPVLPGQGPGPHPVVQPRRLSVDRVELYQSTEVGALQSAVATAVEASTEDQRHRALVEITGLDALAGGIEIRLDDETEDRQLQQARFEVLDDAIFRRHRRDFSSEGVWELVGAATGEPPRIADPTMQPEEFFWQQDRWFHVPDWANVPAHEGELLGLVDEVKRFAAGAGSWREYRGAVDDWWRTVAQFVSDAQNNFAAPVVGAMEELRLSLVAMGAGMAPDSEANFTALETEFEKVRKAIRQSQPEDGIDGSVQARLDRARDVFAARKLLAVIEFRRGKIIETIDSGMNNGVAALDHAEPLTASEQQKLIRVAMSLASDGLLQEAEVRDALANLQVNGRSLQGRVSNADVILAAERYPMSVWFLRRLFKLESGSWNLDDAQGVRAAEILLEAISGSNPAPLHRFVTAVARPLTDQDCDADASSAKCRAAAAPYNVAIQHLAAIGYRAFPAPAAEQTLVVRPHHSITLTRDDDARRVPQAEKIVPDGSSSGPYFPEGLAATPLDLDGSDLPPFFVAFTHVLERLGFAVDAALLRDQFGLANQESLIQTLSERVREEIRRNPRSSLYRDYELYLCRGRAQDDESRNDADVTFSFVKILAIPKQFVYDLLYGSDPAVALSRWVTARSLNPGNDPENFAVWVRWIQVSLNRLRRMARRKVASQHFGDLFLELRGGRYTTIPSVRDRSRVALPLSNIEGQKLAATVRPLSRYTLLAQWLGETPTVDLSREITIEGLDYRPFYAADQRPEEPAQPVGYALPDRIVWLTTKTPDGGDSIDNLLTRIRTGHQGHVTQNWHRAIDVGIETGTNAISLPNILAALEPSNDIGSSRLEDPTTRLIRSDLRIPLFENESAIVTRHPPYFFEFGMSVRNVYDAIFESTDEVRDQTPYLRAEPTQLRCRVAGSSFHSAQVSTTKRVFPAATGDGIQFRPGSVHRIRGKVRGLTRGASASITIDLGVTIQRIRRPVPALRSDGKFEVTFQVPDHAFETLEVEVEGPGSPTLEDIEVVEDGHIRIFLPSFVDHLTAVQQRALPDEWIVTDEDREIPLRFMPDLWMHYMVLKSTDDPTGPADEASPIVEVILPWHPSHREFAEAKLQPLSTEFVASSSHAMSETRANILWQYTEANRRHEFAIDLNIADKGSGIPVPVDELLVYAFRAGEPVRLVDADGAGTYARMIPD